MGKSDTPIKEFYDQCGIQSNGDTALLGFIDNNWYSGDCYDIQLKNWEINDPWSLAKKYNTIICLRTAFFGYFPMDFMERCATSLKPGGKIYVDWGLGGHFYKSTNKFILGWESKNERQIAEYSGKKAIPYSCIWSDRFEQDPEVIKFKNNITKFGYTENLGQYIKDEVPKILTTDLVNTLFDIKVDFKTLWEDKPQLYILLTGTLK